MMHIAKCKLHNLKSECSPFCSVQDESCFKLQLYQTVMGMVSKPWWTQLFIILISSLSDVYVYLRAMFYRVYFKLFEMSFALDIIHEP